MGTLKNMVVYTTIKDACSFINNAEQDLIVRNLTIYDANTNSPIGIVIKQK